MARNSRSRFRKGYFRTVPTRRRKPLHISHPELAKEFHAAREASPGIYSCWLDDGKPNQEDGDLWTDLLLGDDPEERIFADLDQKVWWVCRTCSHEWKANVRQRARGGSGCPHCSGRAVHSDGRNSMKNTHPELAEEFHPTKNGDFTPDILKAGTNKKLWWKCMTCSHEWQAQGKKRAKGSRCPRKRIH